MIEFPIGTSGGSIFFAEEVIEHFRNHRQIRWFQSEAGGQLFAKFDNSHIIIEKATGPRQADKRSRYFYFPNRREEQREIDLLHASGLHFVGDWHTHPQLIPVPSISDRRSIRDCFKKSCHQLNGFILVIVGKGEFYGSLYVSIFSISEEVVLVPKCPK